MVADAVDGPLVRPGQVGPGFWHTLGRGVPGGRRLLGGTYRQYCLIEVVDRRIDF